MNIPEIPLHSHVRSFDFARGPRRDGQPCELWDDYGRDIEGESACYVEGVVCAIVQVGEQFEHFKSYDCDRYAIRVTRRVFSGHVVPFGEPEGREWVFPPVNGTPSSMGRFTHNVEVV